ncbi:anti-sigma factor [Sporosarcina ureae]|uniref:anti-sigma factor n=1 Tax=Sporosarcina ureae TaxID=1571 RepID=UPI0028A67E97|nr:anti-sigma factor [Sporosarcina ureae]
MNNDNKDLGEKKSLSDQSLLSDLIGAEDEIWEAMHFDFEVVEEPLGLKEEVLNFVLESEDENVTPWGKIKTLIQSVRNQFTPLTTSMSAAMLLGIFMLITPLIQGPSVEKFSEISATMKLNVAEGEDGEVYGQAFLINKSGKEELVVSVFDFPQTKGQEVYQVWLIDNGQRQSAGIFRPDKEGYGVLTVDMSKLNSFDTIGITLEPNTNSKQPRGKKIVGT